MLKRLSIFRKWPAIHDPKIIEYYRLFRAVFFFFGFIFFYFKSYKFNRFIDFYIRKVKGTPYGKKRLDFWDAAWQKMVLHGEDILVALMLAILALAIYLMPARVMRIIFKFIWAFLGIFIIFFFLLDSQVYNLMNVHLNEELLNIAVSWPLTLVQGSTMHNTWLRIARYTGLITAMVGLFIYISFIRNYTKMPKRSKTIRPFFVPLLIIYSLVFSMMSPVRKIDDLQHTPLTLYTLDVIQNSEMKNRQAPSYLKEYPVTAGSFEKATGLKHLDWGKTNVIFVLLESTSYSYLLDEETGPVIFPFLNSLRNSKQAIEVENYFTHIPHSSISRTSMMTGNYIRPDRFFRDGETYNDTGLVQAGKAAGYQSFFLHSCNLTFENQREYFTRMGMTVYDGMWMNKSLTKPRIGGAVSWGADDNLLNTWHMKRVLEKTGHLTADGKLSGKKDADPFIAFFSHIGSHHPYGVPRGYKQPANLPKAFKKNNRTYKRYVRALNYADQVSRNLFTMLEKAGLRDDTLFIVLADHGESFKEHGFKIHNFSMFNEEARVPFFMVHKSFINSKVRKIETGAHIDIYPTIMDIMGTEVKVKVNGQSFFKDAGTRRYYVNSWTRPIQSAIVEGRTKYIYHRFNDTLEKYDLDKDPLEKKPVVLDKNENLELLREMNFARFDIIKSHNRKHRIDKNSTNKWPDEKFPDKRPLLNLD